MGMMDVVSLTPTVKIILAFVGVIVLGIMIEGAGSGGRAPTQKQEPPAPQASQNEKGGS